jgi:hypothetical protein
VPKSAGLAQSLVKHGLTATAASSKARRQKYFKDHRNELDIRS